MSTPTAELTWLMEIVTAVVLLAIVCVALRRLVDYYGDIGLRQVAPDEPMLPGEDRKRA